MGEISGVRRRFVRAAMNAPFLEREEERLLAVRWKDNKDESALHQLTAAHMRLVIALASRFRHYGLPMADLVQEGHVGSVMASYNEIDGIPSHINHWLLGKVLRQEWGFNGFITSDGDGLQMLVNTHHVAATKADAARLSIAAGVDYDLSDGSVYRTLL